MTPSLLYVIPDPTGAVTVFVPVATLQVGCVVAIVGATDCEGKVTVCVEVLVTPVLSVTVNMAVYGPGLV